MTLATAMPPAATGLVRASLAHSYPTLGTFEGATALLAGSMLLVFIAGFRLPFGRHTGGRFQALLSSPGAGLATLLLLSVLPVQFLPWSPRVPGEDSGGWREIFVFAWLNADALVFAWLMFWTRPPAASTQRWRLRVTATTILTLGLVYEVYEVTLLAVFGRQPVLYDDALLSADLLSLLLDLPALGLVVVAAWITAVVGMLASIWWSLGTLSRSPRQANSTRAGITGALLLALLTGAHLERGLSQRDNVVQSPSIRLVRNIADSWSMYRSVPTSPPKPPREISLAPLTHPPHVFLMVVESYGVAALTEPEVQETLRAFYDDLVGQGWSFLSLRSLSPVTGGASWLSTATLLSGRTIDNQHSYRRFIAHPVGTMPDIFSRSGYRTVTIQAANRPRPGRPLTNSYHFDHTYFAGELRYKGRPFGWGVIPDQYSLGFVHADLLASAKVPHFVFFMTVSSHGPWDEVPPWHRDWRRVGMRQDRPSFWGRLSGKIRRRFADPGWLVSPTAGYGDAVSYSLKVILDYASHRAPQPSVFIVVGDHQPPFTGQSSDAATPLHVLTSDLPLANALRDRGFADGWLPALSLTIHHRDLFRILVGALNTAYGNAYGEGVTEQGGTRAPREL